MKSTRITARDLVAECLERYDDGGPQAVEELLVRHPGHADEVRERLRVLMEAGLLEASDMGSRAFPQRLGDFRLIERLGGGGMGVVYLAEQEPLGRRVALKLIRPDLLYFDRARERFKREVEIVARLKHPGIVPIYTVGEEDGIPFYAMEHVEGLSLDEVVRTLRDRDPRGLRGRDLLDLVGGAEQAATLESGSHFAEASWVDVCLHVTLQLARVLEHAHGQGILHRDLKPSNIMLAPGGRVLLLDFGLASTRGTSKLTRTGSQLGSLPYMAPEQLRGKLLDERTDLYALGVTLYELLTLRLPYLERDSEVTRRRILEGRVRAVREQNAGVPSDVETVCMVAMDRDPARRYAGARSLADDLSALLQRRPITARRPGTLLRARRCAQRHPAASVGLGLGTLLLIGALGFGLREHELGRAVADARAERDDAATEAQAGVQRALGATKEMMRHVRHTKQQDMPGGDDLSRRLIERATRIHEELLAQYPDDPVLRLEAVEASNWKAHNLQETGNYEAGDAEVERSFALLHGLREDLPDEVRVLEALVFALQVRSRSLEAAHRDTEGSLELVRAALSVKRQAQELLERRGVSGAKLAVARRELATQQMNVAAVLGKLGRGEEAVPLLCESRLIVEQLLVGEYDAEGPNHENNLFILLATCGNLGATYIDLGRLPEAVEANEAGIAVFEELVEIDARPNYAIRVVAVLSNLSLARRRLGDLGGAVEAASEAVERARELALAHPARFEYRVYEAHALRLLGSHLGRVDPDGALAVADEALVTAERLAAEHPDASQARELVIHASDLLVRLLLDQGQADSAAALALENLAAIDALAERWPVSGTNRPNRSFTESQLAEALLGLRRLDEARARAEHAIETRASVLGDSEQRDVAWQWSVLARVAAAQADHERAIEACRKVSELPASTATLRHTAGVLVSEEQLPAALELLERALAAGFRETDDLRTAPELAALRGDARFAELLERAAR